MFVILSTDASGQKGILVSLRICPRTQLLTLEKEAQVQLFLNLKI